MSILVIAEHDNQALKASTLNTITAARSFNHDIDILVLGNNCQSVADEACRINGMHKVMVIDDASLAHFLAETMAPNIAVLAEHYSHVLIPGTTFGKNILPRVAALLDVGQLSDVTDIVSEDTFIRPIYAGNALSHVQSHDKIICISIRPTAFDPALEGDAPCDIETLEARAVTPLSEFIKAELTQSARPELTTANIVVSGGRGLGSAENFNLIEQLADALGAAIGASRAAVDAGFVPNDYQVGQTGKVVAPDLYIAVGISGAIQHIAGMKDSKIIVAINKDADAPIFQIATYGLVGDLFKILPEIIETLE